MYVWIMARTRWDMRVTIGKPQKMQGYRVRVQEQTSYKTKPWPRWFQRLLDLVDEMEARR